MFGSLDYLFAPTARERLIEREADIRARKRVANTTRLWWWKMRMSAKKERDAIAKRTTSLNMIHSMSVPREVYECEQFAKAACAEHIAQSAPSAMLMAMALHEAKQRLARCGS